MKPIKMIERLIEVDDLVVQRASVGSPERILEARALRYGIPYNVTDDGRSFYHEAWRSGVFDKSLVQRGANGGIPVKWHHKHDQLPYGAVIGATDSKVEFVFRAKIVNGDRGDEMIELIEMGAVGGVSVGARIFQDRRIQGGYERIEAGLNEISLSSNVQIPDGKILAMRAVIEGIDEEVDEQIETPSLSEAEAYLASLKRPWED